MEKTGTRSQNGLVDAALERIVAQNWPLLRVISRTKAIANDNRSISIAQSGKRESGSPERHFKMSVASANSAT
jgi:hypothetical protein